MKIICKAEHNTAAGLMAYINSTADVRATSRGRHADLTIGIEVVHTTPSEYIVRMVALRNKRVLFSSDIVHSLSCEEYSILCLHGITTLAAPHEDTASYIADYG